MNDTLFCSSREMLAARNYNRWVFDLFERYVRGRVLEVGCGVGVFTRLICAKGGYESFSAVDLSAEAIEMCRESISPGAVDLICGNATAVEGQFDLIICMNVLEHVEDDVSFVKHLVRCLTTGGVLFLLMPAHPSLFCHFDQEGGHYRRYTKAEMVDMVSMVCGKDTSLGFQQFYFNMAGAVGYFFTYRVRQKKFGVSMKMELKFFDRLIVPVMKRVEGRNLPFGLSLVAVVTKNTD